MYLFKKYKKYQTQPTHDIILRKAEVFTLKLNWKEKTNLANSESITLDVVISGREFFSY